MRPGLNRRPGVGERPGADENSPGLDTTTQQSDSHGPNKEERVWPYNPITSTLDLRYLRSTDLPCNSFVHLPDALEESEEIKVQNMKRELIKATEDYIMEQKEKRNQDPGRVNLTKEETKGLKQLKEREDIVIFQTDKSGRFAVDTHENYILATTPHVENDIVVDEKEHDEVQRMANAHTAMWLRFSKAGECSRSDSEYNRIKSSLKVNNHGYAPLYTLRKDHKKAEDPNIGPPTRPVCGGSAGYNHKISHLLGYFLRPVWQEGETVCTSTEEMLAAIEEVNMSGKLDQKCVIGSIDVKALYPSLDIGFVSEKVGEMFLRSGIEVPEIDAGELGLYLALNRTPDQLREKGLHEYCPRRRTDVGRPPKMTGCGMAEQREKRFTSFHEAENGEPDQHTCKKMIAEAISIGVEFVMKNHLYIFNKEVRKQSKGGPIGLALTGDVAQVFMCWWDQELIKRAEDEGLEMVFYKRYVDDGKTIARRIRDPIPVETDEEADVTIMKEIQQVADDIHESIKVTYDCPSINKDLKLPHLDLKVWLQSVDDGDRGKRIYIMHEFYYKDVATKAVIHARSAIPTKTMRTTLAQEVIRILRNCSRRLPWEVACKHVETFCARMQYSGHSIRMRAQVIRTAIHAYEKMKQKDLSGEEPMYRPRGWKKAERVQAKRNKRKAWFSGKAGKNETVIFVPATPGSDLKKRYLRVVEEAGMGIAIVETPGTSLKKRLQKSDPFRQKKCGSEETCMVCGQGGEGGKCRREGVTYEVECKECGAVYIGETARNAHTRGLEHQTCVTKKDLKSPLYSHCVEAHEGRQVAFSMKVTGIFGGDALKRQISEGVNIRTTPADKLLNRKDEWRHAILPQSQICSQ